MRGLWGLYVGAFVVSLGYGMLTPFVGGLIADTQSSVLTGLLIGVYPLAKAAGYAVCLFPKARTWPASAMLFLTTISYAGLGFTLDPFVIGIARCVEGFVFGWFLAKASVDLASSGRAVGYRLSWLNGISSAGVLAGPLIIAGISLVHKPQSAFVVAALLCTFAIFFQRRTSSNITAPGVTPPLPNVLKQLFPVWSLATLFALFDLTFGALSLSIPIAFQSLGDKAISATAVFFSGGFLIFTIFMPMFGYLADRREPLSTLVIALAIIVGLFGLAGIARDPFQVGGALTLEYVAAAAAYAAALTLLGKLAPNTLPLVGVGQSLAMAAGSIVAGTFIGADGASRVFVFLSLSYLTILLLILGSAKRLLNLSRGREQAVPAEAAP